MSVDANQPAEHTTARGDAPSRRRKAGPVIGSRVGGLVAFAGLVIALISLYLPWVSGGGGSVTGAALPKVLGLREITPVNFLGLVVL